MSRILGTVLAVVAGVLAIAGTAGNAIAQKRVALVIGTDKYDNLDTTRQLQRAVNDARAVAASFKSLGFEVIAAENTTRAQFNAQWQKFLDRLTPGDTAAIYYAGHGVEIEGLNFLLPRDIPDVKFGRQEQIKRESLSVAEILLDLRGRNPEIALVILDACRDNPLVPDEMRSAGGARAGLAPIKGEPPKGTFIMYSAGAGESALDRLPRNDPDRINSIFTRKLVPLLATKGLALHDMARQLRADVIELAATVPHVQRPAYYDGVIGRYCIAGCDGAAQAQVVTRAEPSAASMRLSEAAEAWSLTKDTTSVVVLEAFIARYKETFYVELARARIEELKQKQVAAAKLETEAKSKRPVAEETLGLLQLEKPGSRGSRPLSAAEQRALKPKDSFKECDNCPEMVVVQSGSFTMGTPTSDPDRIEAAETQIFVSIAKPFAAGRFAITRGEYAAFVAATGHKTGEDCWLLVAGSWKSESNRNWRSPGFTQDDRHPVVCVAWHDAKAYVQWLASSTGKPYRLLSETEREYITRAGTTTPFWFGSAVSTNEVNYNPTYWYAGAPGSGTWRQATIPVDSLKANPWGFYNVHGNVIEWTEDCWDQSNVGNPGNGSARTTGACDQRVVRGGTWNNTVVYARSGHRDKSGTDSRSHSTGFRVARTL